MAVPRRHPRCPRLRREWRNPLTCLCPYAAAAHAVPSTLPSRHHSRSAPLRAGCRTGKLDTDNWDISNCLVFAAQHERLAMLCHPRRQPSPCISQPHAHSQHEVLAASGDAKLNLLLCQSHPTCPHARAARARPSEAWMAASRRLSAQRLLTTCMRGDAASRTRTPSESRTQACLAQ